MAEALRLALGAVHAVRHIQTLKREVALGGNLYLSLQREVALRQQDDLLELVLREAEQLDDLLVDLGQAAGVVDPLAVDLPLQVGLKV